MKELIRQIEFLKTYGDRITEDFRNSTIDQIIAIVESYTVIKAKALRWKDTKRWAVMVDEGDWDETQYPVFIPDEYFNQSFVPDYIELVDIIILEDKK